MDSDRKRLVFGSQLFDLLAAHTFLVGDRISDYAVGTSVIRRQDFLSGSLE